MKSWSTGSQQTQVRWKWINRCSKNSAVKELKGYLIVSGRFHSKTIANHIQALLESINTLQKC